MKLEQVYIKASIFSIVRYLKKETDKVLPIKKKMKKYKSVWEKEKSRREAEDKLKKVVAKSKKVTEFFHIKRTKKQHFRNDVQ